MNNNALIKIEYYLEIVISRRWLIIIPFCISMILGIYFAITLPRIYESSTMIFVEPQRVPSKYVESLVSTDISVRVSTIQEQIKSRANIKRIMEQFDLFSGPEYKNMYLEDKLDSIRKRISVKLSRKRGGPETFIISYRGRDPKKVKQVAQALADSFINENLKYRESQAIGTSIFLQDELKDMEKQLRKVEAALNEYKRKHMGELPEQLSSNLSLLGHYQLQLIEKQKALNEAKMRYNDLERVLSLQAASGAAAQGGPKEPPEVTRLRELKAQLAALTTRYTDRHPDVIRTKKLVADLEREIQRKNQEAAKLVKTESGKKISATGIGPQGLMQLDDVRREILSLQEDLAFTREQIEKYQKRVEATPKREQELLSLQRNYKNIQESYNSLLARKLEADISVNLERKQKGERFRIVDSANLPQRPAKPNMKLLFIGFMGAGLAIGGGLVFLLEFLDKSFKQPDQIESTLGVDVIATIPRILTPWDFKWRKVEIVMSFMGCFVAFILFAVFGLMAAKGVQPVMRLAKSVLSI